MEGCSFRFADLLIASASRLSWPYISECLVEEQLNLTFKAHRRAMFGSLRIFLSVSASGVAVVFRTSRTARRRPGPASSAKPPRTRELLSWCPQAAELLVTGLSLRAVLHWDRDHKQRVRQSRQVWPRT